MIELDFKEYKVNIKNEASEINLDELIKVTNVFRDDKSNIKIWFRILGILSDDERYVYMSDDMLFDVIGKLNINSSEFIKEIKIGDKTYSTEWDDNDQPKLNLFYLSELEDYINNNPDGWVKDAMCLLFKIEKDTKGISESLTGDIVIPYINHINTKLTTNFEKLNKLLMDGNKGLH
jgi:hypothetical protein